MMDDLLPIVLDVLDPCLLASLAEWAPTFSSGEPPEYQEIYEAATSALAQDPSNTQAYFQRGVVCQSKGWHAQALADYGDVLRREPGHARAWLLLSEVLDSLGQMEKAKKARQRALELNPRVG